MGRRAGHRKQRGRAARCAFDIQHCIFNGGVLAVECAETRVCTAVDPQQGRVNARALPEKLVQILSRP
jgi:hypothetical protein